MRCAYPPYKITNRITPFSADCGGCATLTHPTNDPPYATHNWPYRRAGKRRAPAITKPLRLTQVLRRESRQLELAADFATLFLLAPPGGVSPYAGHYPHTTAAEERRQMNVLLVEHGLAAQENEPSDHIAIQLALMARMVTKEETLSAQYYFLHHHIMCWAPLFRDSCQQRDEAGFYARAVSVIVGFIREDEQYLESLLMDDFYLSSQR